MRSTFVNTSSFPLSGKEADDEWHSLFPPGNGFITFGLPSPSSPDQQQTKLFGFSMFHQLHCLNSLRRALEAGYGVASPSSMQEFNHPESFHHVHHCLHYLRQALLCSGDPTLEPEADHSIGGVAGVGVTHTCRDKSLLYKLISLSRESQMT